ncbi:MAG: response regulator, partial [Lachnospiraceae bacterium]|nr:response regulator [Lachnospiraceae bacterium]
MASILAVDDEAGILDMIQSILRKDGHSVTGITRAEEIDYTKVGSFDLILLDIMMPGIDGFTLCKKLRNQVDCPILFLTAKSEENSLVNGLSLGADDYICKPFGVMELRARISAHLRREHR